MLDPPEGAMALGPHSRHSVLPSLALNQPASHTSHAEELMCGLKYPATHMLQDELVVGSCIEPGKQTLQVVDPAPKVHV